MNIKIEGIKKYLTSPKYYLLLFVKKSKIYLHNKFEKHVDLTTEVSIENFKIFLWQHLIKNLSYNEKGYFFSTKVTNNNSPMVLSQARVILILSNNKNNFGPRFQSVSLVRQMTDYLISMRDKKRGLFKFNQASWDLQDEGIASVWATLALIRSYEFTNDKRYLDIAIETMDAMLKHLYTKETSLIHTDGDFFWCLNSASTFADACSLILKYHYSDNIKEAMIDSINLCLDKIADDGHYPYNMVRQGTYLLLYHPIVMITLNNCLDSEFLDKPTRNKIIETNKTASKFLLSCFDDNNRIFEPEITHYDQYIISNITTLVALKNQIPKELEKKLLKNLTGYYNNNHLYLCKDENNKLFNSDLYSVKDVLTIEVLYWLEIYYNKS